jgi:hypothetical protein
MRLYNKLKKYTGTITKKNKGVLIVYEGNDTSAVAYPVAFVSVINVDNTTSTVSLFAAPATDTNGDAQPIAANSTSYLFFPFSVAGITSGADATNRISIYELF